MVWAKETGKVNGPLLFDEDNVYEVSTVGYENGFNLDTASV